MVLTKAVNTTRVDKSMNHFNYSLILPVDKSGEPDHRSSDRLVRIREEQTEQTINELNEFDTHAQ